MRVTLQKRTIGEVEFGIIYGGLALLALASARLPSLMVLVPACVFKGLTGIPCPTCGSTRSVIHLSHGDISAALFMNPLAVLIVIAAVVYFLYCLITLISGLPRLSVSLSDKEKNIMRMGVVLALLSQWFFLVATR
jgi:hypothetical protein